MSEPTIYNPSIYNAPTIYNTGANGGGGGGGPDLPGGYEKHKYLQNNGNDYILCNDISISSAYSFETEFANLSTNDNGRWQSVFRTDNTYATSLVSINDPLGTIGIGVNNGLNSSPQTIIYYSQTNYDLHKVFLNKNSIKIDDVSYAAPYSLRTWTYLYIFRGANWNLNGKIGELIIKDGNAFKYWFIPCFGNSENKPGMYDYINGKFYSVNQNNGGIICTD